MVDETAPTLAVWTHGNLLKVDIALVLFLVAGDYPAPAATTAFTAARFGAGFFTTAGAGWATNRTCKADSLVTTAVDAFQGVLST
jgi:hypothetical protein